MLDGGWRYDIAVGGLALVIVAAAWLGLSERQQEYGQRHGCDKATSQHCENAPGGWPESVVPQLPHIQTPPTEPSPNRGEWRSERDLEAQWQTAIWTRYAAIIAALFSAAGLVATGVGIYFVKKTLDANLAVVEKSAEANSISREIGEAQVRAYLMPIEPSIGFEGFFPIFRFKIVNSGASPAFFAIVSSAMRFGIEWPEESMADASLRFVGTIGPGETSRVIELRLNTSIGDCPPPPLPTQNRVVQIHLNADWNDVFKKPNFFRCRYTVVLYDYLSEDRRVKISETGLNFGQKNSHSNQV